MKMNRVALWGKAKNCVKTGNVYTADIIVRRNSGMIDTLVVKSTDYIPEGRVRITGQLRSRRENDKLETYIYVEELEQDKENIDVNEIFIQGTVCSKPFYKNVTNRQLKAFLIAVDGNRCYYIPVVAWGNDALQDINVGDRIIIEGRFQSRLYYKDNIEHIAYELSVAKMRLSTSKRDK